MESLNIDINQNYKNELQKKYQINIPSVENKDGLYITNLLNRSLQNDLRIFTETQIKRLLRSIVSIFLFPIRKEKFYYFSQEENKNLDLIYKYDNAQELSDKEEYAIQNIGHATLLIQIPNFNILTDPIFNNIDYFLYPEKTYSFPDLEKLPKVDAIIISHNHRDHLDEVSLRKLLKYYKKEDWLEPKIFVPLGDKKLIKNFGFNDVEEIDWFTRICVTKNTTKVSFISIPVDHRSGRSGTDHHKSLVTGWVINPHEANVIFKYSGDTRSLSDETQKTCDIVIWNETKNKTINEFKDDKDIHIPDIICCEPSGPNYTRSDMDITHQSASYSILLKFIEAQNLAQISGRNQEYFLEKIHTIMMHHNKFELGPDRFNEGLFIVKKLLNYLNLSKDELLKELEKQEEKLKDNADKEKLTRINSILIRCIAATLPKQTSILSHSKEFIIKEILDFEDKLKLFDNQIINNDYISKFILKNTIFPKIGERLNNKQILGSILNLEIINKYNKVTNTQF